MYLNGTEKLSNSMSATQETTAGHILGKNASLLSLSKEYSWPASISLQAREEANSNMIAWHGVSLLSVGRLWQVCDREAVFQASQFVVLGVVISTAHLFLQEPGSYFV